MAKNTDNAAAIAAESDALISRAEAAEGEATHLRNEVEKHRGIAAEAVRNNEALIAENARLMGLLAASEMAKTSESPHLVIICRTAGFRRGGISHPLRAIYPLDAFTAEQLALFRAEPELELIAVGGNPIPTETPIIPNGPGQPFHDPNAAGVFLSRPEIREQALDAAKAVAVNAPNAGIEVRALEDMEEQAMREGNIV